MTRFNPKEEAVKLNKAMKGFGTDEAAIINILACRTLKEDIAIAEEYRQQFGKELKSDLKSEISGDFYKTCKGLITSLPIFDASQIRRAVKGVGTDEQTLVDVLVPRNNAQIVKVREAYMSKYRRNIEEDIKDDTSGSFQTCLKFLLHARREDTVVPNMVEQDADHLYNAGERHKGTDENVFNRILCHRSFAHICEMNEVYLRKYKKPLVKAIAQETKNDYRKLLETIVNFSCDPAVYYAEAFYESMKGVGTNDTRLQRLVLYNRELGLPLINRAFQGKYRKSLAQFITDDTSGDYKKVLLAIIKAAT